LSRSGAIAAVQGSDAAYDLHPTADTQGLMPKVFHGKAPVYLSFGEGEAMFGAARSDAVPRSLAALITRGFEQ